MAIWSWTNTLVIYVSGKFLIVSIWLVRARPSVHRINLQLSRMIHSCLFWPLKFIAKLIIIVSCELRILHMIGTHLGSWYIHIWYWKCYYLLFVPLKHSLSSHYFFFCCAQRPHGIYTKGLGTGNINMVL